jgi:predicted SPOUT superfamily RNA methylase MTH1
MPEQETIERAREDARAGKSPSTQAGEFVREEMEHIREGKHGARSPQQAIAIGLSKARRAGVKLPPPKRGSVKIKKQAARDLRKAKSRRPPSRRRSRATRKALKRESRQSASRKALSRQARSAAGRRSKASRSRAAKKAAHTRKRKR